MEIKANAQSPSKLLLISLVIAIFATTVIDVIIPLFLVDISKTFGVTPAIASQIKLFSEIAEILPALILGFLVVKFKPKALLIVGVLCIALAALGSYAATSIGYMQFFYSFNGVGSILVVAMALAIVGDTYPMEKKAQAIGVVTAVGAMGSVIGAPLSSFVSGLGGWRSTFSLLVLPVSIVGVLLTLYFVPSKTHSSPKIAGQAPPIWEGYRQIFTRKSAVACLVFQVLLLAMFAIGTFGIAFFKETFLITTPLGSTIVMGGALSAAFGSVVSGRITPRVGRKTLSIVGSVCSAAFAMAAFYMPTLWSVLLLRYTSMWFFGIAMVASASLMLEQVPSLRGSMMSLRAAFSGLGVAIGVAIGGAILDAYNYPTIGLVLGAMGIVAAFVLNVGAKESIH